MNTSLSSHKVCLAPMLDYTDRHFRYLLRLITKKTFLYSEMVTTGAILHGQHQQRYLQFSEAEHPVALQLGGSNPVDLTKSCQIAAEHGYDEFNLNVGCPSPRVKSGAFGAVLMEQPDLVANCLHAMKQASDIPATIKTRIGIDHNDDYQQLLALVEAIVKVGIDTIIVHARKAWLDGLSPKDNREIPPLRYDYVYQLKKDFPELTIIINGGIKTYDEIDEHIKHVDGVMIGREAYHNCFYFHQVDHRYYQQNQDNITRKSVLKHYFEYIEKHLIDGVPFSHMAKHTLGLFHACRGSRLYRRELSENIHKKGKGIEVLEHAMAMVNCD
ncbi:MAG: tRNA dihydrouridine(20/20a) synthase DusA [Gammaproteobacteria bacterium]|nr:tRNA dihydrouridine(20/20a) synthase DusA [Gammaproteobacteria bacterium]